MLHQSFVTRRRRGKCVHRANRIIQRKYFQTRKIEKKIKWNFERIFSGTLEKIFRSQIYYEKLGKNRNKEKSSTAARGRVQRKIIMSRAFYIPPQTQNNNTVGNSELVDILVATLLSLLARRNRCTRRCCARVLYQGPSYVSKIKKKLVRWHKLIKWKRFIYLTVQQPRPPIIVLFGVNS